MSLLHFRFKERRRTVRVSLSVGLLVRGQNDVGEQFAVKTVSQAINWEGGVFPLDVPVTVGQPVTLTNENTGATAGCKVTSVRTARDGKTFVGVEFICPEGNFWRMCFPAPGTKPLRRALPTKSATQKVLA